MIRTVSTHTTAIEAHIVRGRLECEGIPAFVAFEHHIWAKWSLSVALGGVRVQVPFSYLKEAVQVVENINSGKYKIELEEEIICSDSISCPKCGSEVSYPLNWSGKLALVVIFLFLVPLPYTHHLMKCGKCSHTWVASEQRGYPLYVQYSVILILSTLMFVGYALWCDWCKLHCEQPLCI
jgi:ribosomal protein S27AE